MDDPRPTRGERRTDLEERLGEVRRELGRRDELPSGAWVEETAQELYDGSKAGWYYPAAAGGGIAFFARRGREAYGHVHAGGPADATERAVRLATALVDGLPADVASVTLGFTGLSAEEERTAAQRLSERPGSTVIGRRALDRPLSATDGGAAEPPPAGTDLVRLTDVTVEALADLDRRAFTGSFDELLIPEGPDGYRRVLQEMLDGRLGRFVEEASFALVETEPIRLIGGVLTTEQSIRRAILADFVVDPERRRRGLARYLMRAVLRALWALGYESVRLWVTEANRPARGLYDAFGFRTIAEATLYRWDRPAATSHPHDPR